MTSQTGLCRTWSEIPVFSRRGSNKDFFFKYIWNSVLRPFQNYFSSYETGQSVGWRKREDPEKKTPGTPISRTCLVSHVASARLEPSGEMIERLRNSAPNRSATGVANLNTNKHCVANTWFKNVKNPNRRTRRVLSSYIRSNILSSSS